MKIAITGAGGFIGRELSVRALSQGYAVRALVRRIPDDFPSDVEIVRGDLSDKRRLRPALEGCQAVVNLAALVHVTTKHRLLSDTYYKAVNADMALSLADAAVAAGVRRFVQMSSVAALTSSTPADILVGDNFKAAPTSPYGRSKLAADLELQNRARGRFSVVSLRPPTVFGPGVGAYFAQLMRCASAGWPLPLGTIENRRSFSFVQNIADAVLAATTSDICGSFIVTDSPPISTAELYRRLLRLYGHSGRLLPVPAALVRGSARLMLGDRSDSLLGNAAFDGSRFADAFNWSPPVAFEDALARTVGARW